MSPIVCMKLVAILIKRFLRDIKRTINIFSMHNFILIAISFLLYNYTIFFIFFNITKQEETATQKGIKFIHVFNVELVVEFIKFNNNDQPFFDRMLPHSLVTQRKI